MFKIIRIIKVYNINLFTVAKGFTLFYLEFCRRIIDGIRANMNCKHAVFHAMFSWYFCPEFEEKDMQPFV